MNGCCLCLTEYKINNLMRTKIRLAMDFGVQGVLLCFLLFQISFYPGQAMILLRFFAAIIILWQIIHAVYVVQKYQDWYGTRYLKTVRKVVFVALLFFSLTFVFARSTNEMFSFEEFQIIELTGTLLVVSISFPAIKQFGRSSINLYNYYRRPRSFWDL